MNSSFCWLIFFYFPRSIRRFERENLAFEHSNIQVFRYSFAKVTKQFLGLMLMKLKKVNTLLECFEYQKLSIYAPFNEYVHSQCKMQKQNAGIRLLATDQCDGESKLCACNDYVANSLRMFFFWNSAKQPT